MPSKSRRFNFGPASPDQDRDLEALAAEFREQWLEWLREHPAALEAICRHSTGDPTAYSAVFADFWASAQRGERRPDLRPQ
jgi:cold shock protein